jgi:hypothetical protein
VLAAGDQQDGRGQAEADDGQPAGREIVHGELGGGHSAPPQDSGGGQGRDSTTVEVHASSVLNKPDRLLAWRLWLNYIH